MAIYELRTYTAAVGKLAEIVALYNSAGWPALSKHPKKLLARIGNSTEYGEVWHEFWARNHCGFPESELAQLPNCGSLAASRLSASHTRSLTRSESESPP